MKNKVLHLLQSPRFSGAENVVCQIIKMTEEEYDSVYCSCDGQIRDALQERGITFSPIQGLRVKEVRRVINEIQPSIIHSHDMRASFIASLAAPRGIPIVNHIHNNAIDARGVSMKSVAYLVASLRASRIFWVSESAFDGYFYHSFVANKSSILYNIIDEKAVIDKSKLDHSSYSYDVIFLGRLVEPKNPLRLIRVCKKVVEMNKDVRIAIVGTGELELEIKKAITDNNLELNVFLLGYSNNPYKILSDSKVMIMTSIWEGTPMCALESLALGVPIVSTPTDGLKWLIDDDVDGYLSDEDDSLAECIVRIVSNHELQKRLSMGALEKSKRINDLGCYKSKILDAYRECLFL